MTTPVTVVKGTGSILGHFLEKLRGPRTIVPIQNNGTMQTVLTGIALRGFTINITCTQLSSEVHYERWWIRNRVLFTYEVCLSYEGEPPVHLNQALEECVPVIFPNILSDLTSHAAQREAAVGAFLDILISKLPSRGQKPFPIQK